MGKKIIHDQFRPKLCDFHVLARVIISSEKQNNQLTLITIKLISVLVIAFSANPQGQQSLKLEQYFINFQMHAFFHVQYGLNAYIWHVNGFGDVNMTKATLLLQENHIGFGSFVLRKRICSTYR